MANKKTSLQREGYKSNRKSKTKKRRSNKREQAPTKKKHSFGKIVGWSFLISILILSLSVLIGGSIVYIKYGDRIISFQEEAKKLVQLSNRDTFRQTETSLVYDGQEKLISVLKGEKDVYYIPYSDIPKTAIDAMIAIEDKKFLSHEGVDLLAIIRAVTALIRNEGDITQGASTITQQLARNIFLSNEVSYERKMKEIFIAIELEKKYSKEDILEFYFNNIYFANGYYGIEAASKGYFNKSVKELTLAEITFLCAIPNNPTVYNPINHMDNTIGRRNRILDQMLKEGYIGLEEYNQASNVEIVLSTTKIKKHNYVETYVYYCAIRALMEKQGFQFQYEFQNEKEREQYEEKYYDLYYQMQKTLYFEGYRIYTSIDLKLQKQLQKAVDETLKEYKEVNKEGIYTLQGAAVSIDNETGKVVAIVGGRSQEYNGYTLNRGFQSFRQPGSAIKPIIVYTPAFERGYYPDSTVKDEPIEDGPSNSNKNYSGDMELRKAVEGSKNTIAWKLFQELTPQVGLSYLRNMNFSKIESSDYVPAAALGGFTIGVSPVELTSAYATLENDGIFREPTCIVKILDAKGNEIVGDTNKQKRIYETNAARMMTDVLEGVLTKGTGKGLALDNMASAGKTGTTNENKDGWFVGFTPYYTTGVWVGYDLPKSLNNLYGSNHPGTIWKSYISLIHKGLKNKEFADYLDTRPAKEKEEVPEKIEEEEVIETPTPSIEDKTTTEMDNTKNQESNEDYKDGWNEPNDDFHEIEDPAMDSDYYTGVNEDSFIEDTKEDMNDTQGNQQLPDHNFGDQEGPDFEEPQEIQEEDWTEGSQEDFPGQNTGN